jgi:FixJ family two-component response regulator
MPTGRKVIAIIDDDLDVLAAIERVLASLGYKTETYASATDFIDAIMTSEAACVVSDVHLGDITGVEMARHLSALGFTLPTIFMTGSPDPTLRKQAMELGCVAYLQKPFPKDQLAQALIIAIGRHLNGLC